MVAGTRRLLDVALQLGSVTNHGHGDRLVWSLLSRAVCNRYRVLDKDPLYVFTCHTMSD